MMIVDSLLKIYLQFNLLLVASYLFFIAARRLSTGFGFKAPHQSLVRWGQVLIIMAVLSPLILSAIPSRQLPLVNIRFFQPSSEELELRVKKQPHGKKPIELKPISDFASGDDTNILERTFRDLQDQKNVRSALLIVLLTGFFISLLRFSKNALSLRSLLLQSTVIRRVNHICIVVSDSVSVPFSARFFRTRWIVLPVGLFKNPKDLKLALSHELQHHRQGDTLWAVFIEALVCLFYFNPAIYFWKKEITELQEFSCDEALVGQRRVSFHDYGSCLVRVAETALGSRQMYVGTTCMAAVSGSPNYFKSFLRRRIEMIADQKKSPAQRWAGACIGTVTVLLTVAVAYGAERSRRQDTNSDVNPGQVIVDESIQGITERVLSEAIKEEKAAAGFAIVADPNTGRILAVANIDTKHSRTGHWALGLKMEAASIGKSIVAAEAIDRGLTSPQESHSCENGKYKYGDRVYHDWKKEGWPALTTEDTIAFSSDICSIKIGEKLGKDGVLKMLSKFGFGPGGTAQSFPEARPGQIPPADDPQLIPYVSSGFGYHITPIEMLQAYGAIANGGNLMTPLSADASDSQAQAIRRVLTPEGAAKMKEILRQVVLKGTAKGHAESDLYTTAGKTASSFSKDLTQVDWMGGENKSDLAGFIGFAPFTNPKIEVYVVIHVPTVGAQTGAHGSTHASPVFKRIVEKVLKQMNVAPDKPQT